MIQGEQAWERASLLMAFLIGVLTVQALFETGSPVMNKRSKLTGLTEHIIKAIAKS